MPEIRLEWDSAEVQDGKLTIAFDAAADASWRKSFERSVKLLQGGVGDWGDVKLKKKAVTVADVSPGIEDKLRHFLESVVQQANADREEAKRASDSRDDDAEPRQEGPDGEMTARFRSFGDAEAGEDQERS